jgi:hypothetical protein
MADPATRWRRMTRFGLVDIRDSRLVIGITLNRIAFISEGFGWLSSIFSVHFTRRGHGRKENLGM